MSTRPAITTHSLDLTMSGDTWSTFRYPSRPSCATGIWWADSLLGTAAGRLCVIDWNNCGAGEATQELGLILWSSAGAAPNGGAGAVHPPASGYGDAAPGA